MKHAKQGTSGRPETRRRKHDRQTNTRGGYIEVDDEGAEKGSGIPQILVVYVLLLHVDAQYAFSIV